MPSAVLTAFNYDSATNILTVRYHSGRVYTVWTIGHRNPKALLLRSSMAKRSCIHLSMGLIHSDDEINLIEKGSHYGHPLIIGYADGNYSGLAAAVLDEQKYPGKWHTSYPLISNENRNADSIGPGFKEPMMSLYPTDKKTLSRLFTKIQLGEKANWLSYAPSGIAIYRSAAIPGWQQSLLVTSLKTGKLLRLKLNQDGKVNPHVFEYVPSRARYRDVTVSADGTKIYLATDSSAITSGPTTENPKVTSYRGCILELNYKRKALNL